MISTCNFHTPKKGKFITHKLDLPSYDNILFKYMEYDHIHFQFTGMDWE